MTVLRCRECGAAHRPFGGAWRCVTCQGLLDVEAGGAGPFPLEAIRARPASMWRYREALADLDPSLVTMGEGMTPLVALAPGVAAKIEFASPTLSFKDRGAAAVIAAAVAAGATSVVTDSSGNAGTAVAAYAARAAMAAHIYVPEGTSEAKLVQMSAHGAVVHRVPGSREATASVAFEVFVAGGHYVASHVWNPWFTQGTKTFVFEVWEQLGGRLPETLVLPAGNGTLVIGAWLGMLELVAAGATDRPSRIVAVQAEACAPLVAAVSERTGAGPPRASGGHLIGARTTQAEGIAVRTPRRLEQMVEAISASGGTVVTVSEEAIGDARCSLATRGFFVEPTAAVTWAGICDHPELAGDAVTPLCGAGLKHPG
ncbi:MAG: pyridoxal-phosphate dependent enzyme [Acidimicrobiales bacterium]